MAPDNNKITENKSHTFAATSIGKHENTGINGPHFMDPMVKYFAGKHSETQIKWEQFRYFKNSILAAKENGSLEKVDHINIVVK